RFSLSSDAARNIATIATTSAVSENFSQPQSWCIHTAQMMSTAAAMPRMIARILRIPILQVPPLLSQSLALVSFVGASDGHDEIHDYEDGEDSSNQHIDSCVVEGKEREN